MQAQALSRGSQPETVVIVDDDPLVRGSMESLFRSVGLAARSHASAIDALQAPLPDGASCLVVDVRMPHLGGFELQQRLSEQGAQVPIVFVTGHGDIPMSVRAMKAGAIDFLPKPFRDQDMLDAVQTALAGDRARRAQRDIVRQVREQHARLTPREREVMAGVVRGLLNKQIAYELGLSEITVKLHRSSMMKKLSLRTVPDLVRTAQIVADC